MGKAALEGRPGVQNVESGWHGMSEVNRVVYDPQRVTVEQMVGWLKKSGTFVRTLKEAAPTEKPND